MRTRVKVCCIASRQEAAMAIAAGADLLGLVGPMPSGPGPIELERAAEIAQVVPPGVAAVLLTSATSLDRLVAEVKMVRPGVLQLVDGVPPAVLAALREAAPALRLLQVLHVEAASPVAEPRSLAPFVDGFLLDSGRPSAAIKELGGTGRTHDLALSRELVEAVDRPVYLAGGLNPQNVAAALARVRPFGVDLCSGIRRQGRLDQGLLHAFVSSVRNANLEDGTR